MAAPRPKHRIQRLIRLLIISLIAILVLRAVFIEPFTVPTGSMASGIVGRHYRQECGSCGWTVHVGEPADDAPVNALEVDCPNCGHALSLVTSPLTGGDRLLVDKTAFEWRKPRRWEVIVFSGPDDPDRPYLKRVVGLPGETISILDGDVFVNGEIARKSFDQNRAVARPLFDMAQAPPENWAARWKIEPASGGKVAGNELATHHSESVTFTLLPLGGEPWRDRESYNGRPFDMGNDTIHDFLVSFEVKWNSSQAAISVTLRDGADEARLRFARSGASLELGPETKTVSPMLAPGNWHCVELAFVDRRATARVNGKDLAHALDLAAPGKARPDVLHPLTIATEGSEFTIRNLRLNRDLHYLGNGRHGIVQSRLGLDEYFVLGDNSGNSEDSRFWSKPGVPARNLLGKPILIHAPHRWRTLSFMGRTWDAQMIDGSRFGWVR